MLWRTAFRGFPWRVMFVRMGKGRVELTIPRGRGCALYADCRYSLVEPSDLDRVFCILYEGQPRVCRVAGELVNLSRACALSCLMLGSPYPPGGLLVCI